MPGVGEEPERGAGQAEPLLGVVVEALGGAVDQAVDGLVVRPECAGRKRKATTAPSERDDGADDHGLTDRVDERVVGGRGDRLADVGRQLGGHDRRRTDRILHRVGRLGRRRLQRGEARVAGDRRASRPRW